MNVSIFTHCLRGWAWRRIVICVAASLLSSAACHADDSSVIYHGVTRAAKTVVISAPLQGQIKEIKVKMGQVVRRGDVLIELDGQQAELAVELAKLQAAATGDVELAQSELNMQRERYAKMIPLAEEGLARPDEIERALATVQQAAARLQIANEQRMIKQGDLKRMQLQLRLHKILSPIDGVIEEVMHQEGEVVSPGDAAIMRLLNVDWIYAEFGIPVDQLRSVLSVDQYRVELGGSRVWVPAIIDRIRPSIDAKSDTILIHMRIENPDHIFRAGEQCRLRIHQSVDGRPSVLNQDLSIPKRKDSESTKSETATLNGVDVMRNQGFALERIASLPIGDSNSTTAARRQLAERKVASAPVVKDPVVKNPVVRTWQPKSVLSPEPAPSLEPLPRLLRSNRGVRLADENRVVEKESVRE